MAEDKLKGCKRVGDFYHCVINPKDKFDRKSFRTLVRGTHRIVIGCPKGHYDERKKRCKIGTMAQKILKPVK